MAPTDQPSTSVDFESSVKSEVFVSGKEETETKGSDSKSKTEMEVVTESLAKVTLNPHAKEFFPSSHLRNQRVVNENDGYIRRSNYIHGRRRLSRRTNRPQREESIRRTVYVSEVDHNVSEEELASVFIRRCGEVVDCRICGDPNSQLRFGFVEFADEQGAKEALEACGTMVGLNAIRVLPSKTAILPVNPILLPRSDYEVEMVSRTIYCTNIDKLISPADVKNFFGTFCGEVTRLRILGDFVHSTRIAFVEFAFAESAIAALSCSGMLLGNFPIRVSPSKTPVRARPRPSQE